jgi:alkanesulfonate monooxygenase
MSLPVEFIGFVGHQEASETRPAQGPDFDIDYIERSAKAHEAGGFDRVLIAFNSRSPENLLIAQHIAAVTSRLNLMVAHRPGFTQPTITARQYATLDHISRGRGGIHIITGGNDIELRQDGDWTEKDERYARTDEYLDVVKLEWTSEKPFDYDGQFYHVAQGFGGIKPVQKPHIPVYFGGSSPAAIRVAGKHADIYALWGETYDQVRDVIAQVRDAAREFGREDKIRFSLSLRPILADTEDKAWARAERILEQTIAVRQKAGLPISGHAPQNAGSQRLLDAAAKGARLDKRLWTGVAAVTGASGNSTALVGTPDQVADALLDYYDLGVSTFLIRGFDPYDDAVDYGANLLPAFKAKLASRTLVTAR